MTDFKDIRPELCVCVCVCVLKLTVCVSKLVCVDWKAVQYILPSMHLDEIKRYLECLYLY